MLQAVRDKIQGWLAWTVVILIGGAFSLWGVSNFFSSNPRMAKIAKINGEVLLQYELDNLYDRLVMQQEFSQDRGSLSPEVLREVAYEQLIQLKALSLAVEKRGFALSGQQFLNWLAQVPEFQVDGQFSKSRYLQVLSQARYSDQDFRQEMKKNLLIDQLQQGLVNSAFALPSDLKTVLKYVDQKRDIRVARVSRDRFIKGKTFSNESKKEYFEAHPKQFMSDEQLDVEYIHLKMEDVKGQFQPTQNEIESYYQTNIGYYTQPEKVEVAHILIAPTGQSEDDQQKAKQEAHEVLTRLKAGESFEALAKAHSVDKVSAQQAGKLAPFARGEMIPEFEEAAFSLTQESPLSGVVESPFGFHIIQKIASTPETIEPLKEVRDAIVNTLVEEHALEKLIHLANELVTVVYEAPESLEPAATEFDLNLQTTGLVAKNQLPAFMNFPKVMEQLFSAQVLEDGLNSDLIELSQNEYLVLRVKAHLKPKPLAFDAVQSEIEEQLKFKWAQEQAHTQAQQILKEMNSGKDFDEITKVHQLNWEKHSEVARTDTGLDDALSRVVFAMPRPENTIGFDTHITESGDLILVVLDAIHDGKMEDFPQERMDLFKESVARNLGEFEYSLFSSHVMEQAKIKRLSSS